MKWNNLRLISGCGRLVLLIVFLQAPWVLARDLQEVRPEKVGMSSEKLAFLNERMQQHVDDGRFPGVVTLIARRGKIVNFQAYGTLDIEDGKPVKKDSLFRIYSMTKPVVSAVAMMLHEEGRFRLTDPIHRYLPEFKDLKVWTEEGLVEPEHAPTIRELMAHTAGFSYGIFSRTPVDTMYRESQILGSKDLAEFSARLADLPLLYQPGTRWHYSIGPDLLGRLIEVISGQPLDVFLAERLFTPLNMKDTFFQVPAEKLARFGTNHRRTREGELLVSEKADGRFANEVTFFSGGGGLVSTAMDYLRFSQMMLNGGELNGVRLLSPKTVALMTKNHLPAGVSSGFGERPGIMGTDGFGLGVGVKTVDPLDNTGSKGSYSWGGLAGTLFWNDPEEELTAIVMVQIRRSGIPLRDQFATLTYAAIIE